MDCSALGLVELSANLPASVVVASESRLKDEDPSWPPAASTPMTGVEVSCLGLANRLSVGAGLARS